MEPWSWVSAYIHHLLCLYQCPLKKYIKIKFNIFNIVKNGAKKTKLLIDQAILYYVNITIKENTNQIAMSHVWTGSV